MDKINSLQVCVLSRIAHNKPYCVWVFSSKDNKYKPYQMEWPNDMDFLSASPVMSAVLRVSLCLPSAYTAH